MARKIIHKLCELDLFTSVRLFAYFKMKCLIVVLMQQNTQRGMYITVRWKRYNSDIHILFLYMSEVGRVHGVKTISLRANSEWAIPAKLCQDQCLTTIRWNVTETNSRLFNSVILVTEQVQENSRILYSDQLL